MIYEVYIVADSNDADYVSSVVHMGWSDICDKLIPVARAISQHDPASNISNWDRMDWTEPGSEESPEKVYDGKLNIDLINWFDNIRPYADGGIHTIDRIEYYALPEKTRLL